MTVDAFWQGLYGCRRQFVISLNRRQYSLQPDEKRKEKIVFFPDELRLQILCLLPSNIIALILYIVLIWVSYFVLKERRFW